MHLYVYNFMLVMHILVRGQTTQFVSPVASLWWKCATYPNMLLGSQITFLYMFTKIWVQQMAAILFFKMATIFAINLKYFSS